MRHSIDAIANNAVSVSRAVASVHAGDGSAPTASSVTYELFAVPGSRDQSLAALEVLFCALLIFRPARLSTCAASFGATGAVCGTCRGRVAALGRHSKREGSA